MSFETAAAPHPDDTIAALSSAPGGGVRAIVRVSGPKAWDVVGAVFTPESTPKGESPGMAIPGLASRIPRRLTPGRVRLSGVPAPLPADLLLFPGPRSYTGQDLAELHTLGSPPLVERLVADLLAAGARPARPGEFTLRAFLAGKLDLPRAEAVHAVIEAGSDADLSRALAQLAGGVTRPLERVRNDLLDLLADLEAGLDFADEGIEFVPKAAALARLDDAVTRLTDLQRQLDDRGVSGRPVRVVLVGEPNAGKSSLFNAIAGRPEALVSPDAGTTRDYLTTPLTLAGVPVELVDTAGWQAANRTVEEQAQALGREQASRADVLVWCVEPGRTFAPADAATLDATGADVLRVRTKADTVGQDTGHGTRDTGSEFSPVSRVPCPVSTHAPGGLADLLETLTLRVAALTRPPLAPSQSRCRHHVGAAVEDLRAARDVVAADGPGELTAVSLRAALDQLGETVGAVHTPDLLDRIFSRFCIGK